MQQTHGRVVGAGPARPALRGEASPWPTHATVAIGRGRVARGDSRGSGVCGIGARTRSRARSRARTGTETSAHAHVNAIDKEDE